MRRAIIGKNGRNSAMPIRDREMSSDRLNIGFLEYSSELSAGNAVSHSYTRYAEMAKDQISTARGIMAPASLTCSDIRYQYGQIHDAQMGLQAISDGFPWVAYRPQVIRLCVVSFVVGHKYNYSMCESHSTLADVLD